MPRVDYLKILINKHGSQREFAQYIGMTPSTLFSILRNVGGTSIDNIAKICKGLGITADNLAMIGEQNSDGYYKIPEVNEFAKLLHTRLDAPRLFSATKDIKKEALEKAIEYIGLLKLKTNKQISLFFYNLIFALPPHFMVLYRKGVIDYENYNIARSSKRT